jgi:hypothetical protein
MICSCGFTRDTVCRVDIFWGLFDGNYGDVNLIFDDDGVTEGLTDNRESGLTIFAGKVLSFEVLGACLGMAVALETSCRWERLPRPSLFWSPCT